MNDLTHVLAAVVGAALSTISEAQPQTYVGPPTEQCARVRATSAPKVDAASGEVTQSFTVAAYGIPLDLSDVVATGDRHDDQRGHVHGLGSIHRLSVGTVLTSTLPDGTTVEHAEARVSGFPWSFSPEAGEGERSARAGAVSDVAAALADGTTSRLAVWTGARWDAYGVASVEGVTTNADGTTSVALVVRGTHGDAPADALDALAGAARELIGKAFPYLGRVIKAEIVTSGLGWDGRRRVVEATARFA